jgi:SAM-dependent methyltransferase
MDIATNCICCDATTLVATPAVLMPFVAKRAFGWEPVEITPEWGMRDLRPGHAYSVCNTLRCAVCGVVFVDIRFNERELSALYRNYRDEAYTALRERFEPGYRSRNDLLVAGSTYLGAVEAFLLEHMPVPSRLLDWGGDTGLNSPFAGRLRVHDVYDISLKPAIDGAVRVANDALAPGAYDLIVCSNVIEHVPYPLQTIELVVRLMTNETWFYLEVPYEDVIRAADLADAAVVDKKHWHEHINFFTPRSLEALLVRAGLDVIDTTLLSVNAGGKDANAIGLLCRRARYTAAADG